MRKVYYYYSCETAISEMDISEQTATEICTNKIFVRYIDVFGGEYVSTAEQPSNRAYRWP